jgi:NAD-dependent deacetylase
LVRRRQGVALTGAGISVDSGIPDFRSPGGLWERFDPMEFASLDAFRADPDRVWTMLIELEQIVVSAKPNWGHRALARLQQAGVLDGIITQNVDNLHQEAGSKGVIEFHGNGTRLVCLGCGATEDATRRKELGTPPRCRCGQVLKPDVVLFGEMIPQQAMTRSMELIKRCAVMLVVGTSATVVPASLMPMAAKQQEAFLAEFDLAPTAIATICDESIYASASQSLPLLADRVEHLLGN